MNAGHLDEMIPVNSFLDDSKTAVNVGRMSNNQFVKIMDVLKRHFLFSDLKLNLNEDD